MNTVIKSKILILAIGSIFLELLSYNQVYALPLNTENNTSVQRQQEVDEHKHDNEQEHKHSENKHDDLTHQNNPINNQKNDETEEEHEEGITLSPQKMSLATIKVDSINPEYHFSTVYAPGEVKANGYSSYVVSPRTESVIISRHAALGEHVEIGQTLVTLFSETVAQAQADYLIASTEWRRIKTLGNKTVSESRLLQAQTTYKATYGRLIALGLTEKSIANISNKDISTFGQYSLIAQREGVVLLDDFIQGQRVAAGDTIMMIADEKQLWVEARVSPNKNLQVSIDSEAYVTFEGQAYNAKVIQEAHTIDPITRTRIIRLAVNNEDDNLHSGMFVKVNFKFATQDKVMAVPEDALIRSADGDWTVFVEDHPGEFKATEIKLGRSLGNLREIIGLDSGTRIVTKGAFFVASEIAKSGFDPHNH